MPAAGPAAEGASVGGRREVIVDGGGEGGGEDGDKDADEGEERRQSIQAAERATGLHNILELFRTSLSRDRGGKKNILKIQKQRRGRRGSRLSR